MGYETDIDAEKTLTGKALEDLAIPGFPDAVAVRDEIRATIGKASSFNSGPNSKLAVQMYLDK